MTQSLINFAGGAVTSALKNTHCTITLNGWPAVAAIVGTGLLISGGIVAIVAITEHGKRCNYYLEERIGA